MLFPHSRHQPYNLWHADAHVFPTSLVWVGCRENSQKAAAGRVGVGQHLQEHLVAGGDQGPGFERAAEAAEPLAVDVPAVNVHVVVAAQVVALQVNKAERQDHHLSLRDLGAVSQQIWVAFFFF